MFDTLVGARFLITGGCGFIGANLVRSVIAQGGMVHVLDNLLTGKEENLPRQGEVVLHREDLRTTTKLDEILADVHYGIHAACVNIMLAEQDPFLVNDTNITGTLRLIEAAHRAAHLRKVVNCSSASVYGNPEVLPIGEHCKTKPLSAYAVTKLAGEHYAQIAYILRRMPVTVLRYSNVYGPLQTPDSPYSGVIGHFFGAAQAGKQITVYGNGSQTRDFTYIDDVVEATLAATLSDQAIGRVFNVATGHETSVNDLATRIAALYGLEPDLRYIRKRENIDNISRRCLSVEQIRITLQWEPVYDLNSGLRATKEWFDLGPAPRRG